MKKILLLSSIFLLSLSTFGQNFEMPSQFKFSEPEDYKLAEDQVKSAIDWCLETPLNVETAKRKAVNAYVMIWLTGTPDVSIEMDDNAAVFFKTNPDLLMIFMMGWIKYSLENNSNDNVQGFKAGTEAAVAFYRKNIKFLKKDEAIEKYEKLIEKGKLDEELKKILTK